MDHKTLEQKKSLESDSTYSIIGLYLQPEFIKILTQQIASQPHVDLTKITAIKAAIKNQSLELNNLNLAEKIINFETKLFNK